MCSSKKVTRKGNLEKSALGNRGLLLDAYTENTQQQKSDSDKFKEGYVKKKKGKTQPKVEAKIQKTPEPSPEQGRRVPKPRFGTLVPEQEDPPPVEAIDSWEDIEAPVMPVPRKVAQEIKKNQKKNQNQEKSVVSKENDPDQEKSCDFTKKSSKALKPSETVSTDDNTKKNKAKETDVKEKGSKKEKSKKDSNKIVEEKPKKVKDTGDDLADILDNLQIDETKASVRRSDRKTASEILKLETDRIIEQLKKDNDEGFGIKVEVFPEKGRGIVTTRDRKKGEFVVEYAGDLINIDSANERETEYSMDVSKGCYMYYFKHQGKQYCVDATEETGRFGRLLNHSCKHPNHITKVLMLDDSPKLYLVAKHDFGTGTELVYDYGDRDKATIKAHPWLAL